MWSTLGGCEGKYGRQNYHNLQSSSNIIYKWWDFGFHAPIVCVPMPRFPIYYLDFYVNNRCVNISIDLYRFVRIWFGVPQQHYGSGDCRPYVF